VNVTLGIVKQYCVGSMFWPTMRRAVPVLLVARLSIGAAVATKALGLVRGQPRCVAGLHRDGQRTGDTPPRKTSHHPDARRIRQKIPRRSRVRPLLPHQSSRQMETVRSVRHRSRVLHARRDRQCCLLIRRPCGRVCGHRDTNTYPAKPNTAGSIGTIPNVALSIVRPFPRAHRHSAGFAAAVTPVSALLVTTPTVVVRVAQ
jgi:hypothetical protein